MNKVILVGRLTRDPELRYSQGQDSTAFCRYILAVNRRFKKDGEDSADFIQCIAFGKSAEFAEKYFRQGVRVSVSGRIRTGSFTNREGQKVYTTQVVIEEQEFAESRRENPQKASSPADSDAGDGFMNVPDRFDEEFPFS